MKKRGQSYNGKRNTTKTKCCNKTRKDCLKIITQSNKWNTMKTEIQEVLIEEERKQVKN